MKLLQAVLYKSMWLDKNNRFLFLFQATKSSLNVYVVSLNTLFITSTEYLENP